MSRFMWIQELRLQSKQLSLVGIVTAGLLLLATPALAHHPFGGETPMNAIQGFLSGLGHPVIGLDHLAFVIAAGLLAAAMHRAMIPIAFVLAALAGTGGHLIGIDLPAPEFTISASVLIFGGLLAMKQQPSGWIVTMLAAMAGVFHGYAYGEAIIGADMTSLFAYLLGFTAIQLLISMSAYFIAARLSDGREKGMLNLRFAGFALAGVGGAFLSSVVLG